MRVGFTGTREGLSMAQIEKVLELLRKWKATSFIHGGCIGADSQIHSILETASTEMMLGVYPSNLPDQRGIQRCWMAKPDAPLTRNKKIVAECERLIACPEGLEVVRSGTWSTIRHAKKVHRWVTIVWPNGVTATFPGYVSR